MPRHLTALDRLLNHSALPTPEQNAWLMCRPSHTMSSSTLTEAQHKWHLTATVFKNQPSQTPCSHTQNWYGATEVSKKQYRATGMQLQSVATELLSGTHRTCPLDPKPTWLLKKLVPFIVPVISHLCNLSLQSGTFPQRMKEATVYPRTILSNSQL